jgi:hypothetical protein
MNRRRTDQPREHIRNWHRLAFLLLAVAAVYAVVWITGGTP